MIKDTDQTDVHRSEPNSCKKWKDGHSRDGCPLRHQRHLSRHRGAKLAMDDVASTHLKPVNPSVILIKLAKSRLMAPSTQPEGLLKQMSKSGIGSQSTFCKQIAPTKGTALLPRSAHGRSEATETHKARSANHAASPSNLKGLFVPLRIVILFKNVANSEKAGRDTDIKPFSFSCRMQIAHQGNSLPLDRYSFSQRTKRTGLAGYTSVMSRENLYLPLESL